MSRIKPPVAARTVRGTLITVVLAVAGTCLFGAQSASAAVSCIYEDEALPKRMSVLLNSVGETAVLSYDSFDHQLLVNGDVCTGPHGLALDDNVDEIDVQDNSLGGTIVRIEDPAAFAPGATPEGPLNGSEIEFHLSLGAGNDQLVLAGADTPDKFTVGADGVNTGAGPLDFDLEVTGSGIDQIQAYGNGGADEISGQGGRGTGAAWELPMHIYGGTSGDILAGGAGNDDLSGEAGGDSLEGGLGADYLDGGTEADIVSYAHAPAGVQVTLDALEPLQHTGGAGADHLLRLEQLVGSEHADELRTALLKGHLSGGAGDDRITGGAGGDQLNGDAGDDLIDPGPEATVTDYVFGGLGFDTVTYARAPKAVALNLQTDNAEPRDGIGYSDELSGIDGIEGSPFADLLQADGDANTIDGLAGADQINAREGDDLVRARDGEGDSVDCGDGTDSAVADTRTLDSLTGCEAADVPPDPPSSGGEPSPAPAADTTLRLSISARRAQRLLARHALVVSVTCAGEPCRVRAGGRLGGLRLKRVSRSIAADTRTRLKVPLSSTAIRRLGAALDRGRHPKLTLSVRATDAAGNSVTRTRSIAAAQS